MQLTAQTVTALMMPSVFCARCFFHHPLLHYIAQTLVEVEDSVVPHPTPPLRQSDKLCAQVSMGKYCSSTFCYSTASPCASIWGPECSPHTTRHLSRRASAALFLLNLVHVPFSCPFKVPPPVHRCSIAALKM